MFKFDLVKNPQIFKENRIDAHSDHKYYSSIKNMKSKIEDFSYSLNGLWKFSYAKNYSSSIKGFENMEFDCTSWDDIRVPANIQLEGYDIPPIVLLTANAVIGMKEQYIQEN